MQDSFKSTNTRYKDSSYTHRDKASDVMIVKLNKNDYYVSEKLKDREVYYKLLKNRSRTSTHYRTLAEAQKYAKELQEKLIIACPDCNIIEIDIKNYLENYSSEVIEPIFDNHGRKLGGLTENAGLKMQYAKDEREYRYIDKYKYIEKLDELISVYNSKDFSFRNAGICLGYDIAKAYSIPYLYFEIYKAEELIKTFTYDEELYACDIETYSGYIEALNHSIEIQKECKSDGEQLWTVYVTDARLNPKNLPLPIAGTLDGICKYEAIQRPADSDFGKDSKQFDFYLILTDKHQRTEKLNDLLSIGGNQEYVFKPYITSAKSGKLSTIIESELIKRYTFKQENCDAVIDISWIDSLADIAISNEDSKDDDIN